MILSAAEPCVVLMDNGSLEPVAILKLRALAAALGARLKRKVEPVSLLHADRVPAEQLGGHAAETLEPAVRRRLAVGCVEFYILPLFIGPTKALSDYLPTVVDRLRSGFPHMRLRVAPPLHAAGDDRLTEMLAAQVETVLNANFVAGEVPHVVLVDHGSPVRAVTDVRNGVAAQLAGRLGGRVAAVAPCSMERRAGAEYDFNEPLLERLLRTPPWNAGTVVVAHLFLLPGRHAGATGDVARICREAEHAAGGRLRLVRAGLLSDHPQLLDILADRARTCGLG